MGGGRLNVKKQLFNALNRLVEVDIGLNRTKGFQYLDSREVICGSEHAFRIPSGCSVCDIQTAIDTLIAAAGAPVELIDRAGVVIVRMVEKDFPKKLGYEPEHIKSDEILIGYDRLRKPVYHPLNTHILCGGASGSGKTDGLRWWVYQLIQQGYEVRICDLKGFSFFPFESVPGVSVAKSIHEARDMLVESFEELQTRKEQVIRARSREIIQTFRPVVVVIDEAATLAPKQNRGKWFKLAEECDQVIAYFGQQAREPRMFMIYSTQRPSVDVINLQFRANVEAMIAFRTQDKYNSTMIVGKEGAERILPTTPGRCIYNYDRDHYLQVPYIGNDANWERLLTPLKTEVVQNGRSARAESPRTYLDGSFESAGSDDTATGDTESIPRSHQKGRHDFAGARARENDHLALSWPRESMEPRPKRPAADEGCSDEIV